MADVPESPETSGETTDESSAFAIGDVVHDSDDDTPNDAIVVNLPSKTANEWTAYRDTTVAEDNPGYPADAPVIVVGYAAELRRAFPDWERESHLPLDAINRSDISHYSFPAPRLVESSDAGSESSTGDGESAETDSASDEASAPASDDEEPDTDLENESETTETDEDVSEPDDTPATEADLSDSMRALKDRLEDGGMTVEIEPDGETLSVSKLGDAYRVRPGEVVEGEGALRGRLSSIVDEYA